jgi:prepilin-type N-terminal cleavage/methylation domain-containing protein
MKNNFLKNKNRKATTKGFTLVEILVVTLIFTIIIICMTEFERDIFYLNTVQSGSLSSATDAQSILNTMVKEIRAAAQGADGSYPIVTAGTTTLTFFSDIYQNGVKEKVTYFLSSTTLEKAVFVPTGTPLAYPTATTTTVTLASNVRNVGTNGTSTNIFDYFDTNYTGTSSPLVQPVNISAIRLIRITLVLDTYTNRPLAPVTYTSQVSIRNLKNNL